MKEVIKKESNYIINTYNRRPEVNPLFIRGEGSCLFDADGKRYLDFLSGLAVNVLGHCHPAVVKAIKEQAGKLGHTSNLYYTEPQVLLAERLVKSFAPASKVFFCNSGTEANEAAIKLARKYSPGRYKIITAQGSFHGRTFGAMSATGQPKYREPFVPLLPGFSYAKFNCLDTFAEMIDNETVAIMVEMIQGEGGINVADDSFIEGLRILCDKHDLLLIVDEVQSGMGRTGKFWAYEHWDVMPDIITVAKGLGGGLPIGAMVAGEKCSNLLQPGEHASTFGGNPVVCAAALAVLEVIHQDSFLSSVQDKGYLLKTVTEKMINSVNGIKGRYRGIGLMCALEFDQPVAKIVQEKATEEGLLLNAIGTNILRMLPPLVISNEEITEGVKIIETIIKEL